MDPAKIFREGFEEFIPSDRPAGLEIRPILSEDELRPMMDLIVKDLSEPYSVFTYRYFVHNWPRLCWLAYEVCVS
jgi:peptide alpha-N-acetyltransferase